MQERASRASRTTTDPLQGVIELARARVPQAERGVVERFVRDFYAGADPEDLAERPAADLYGAALSIWSFARKRETATARVRVFNPAIDEHGWQSTHTIVEIVNDDMPFLVDSVSMEINRLGMAPHLLVHPILTVRRDAAGRLVEYLGPEDGGLRESLMHIEIDRVSDTEVMRALEAGLSHVLDDVRASVEDWLPMLSKVREVIEETRVEQPGVPAEVLDTAREFLEWLAQNHFTFVGYRCHDLVTVDGVDALRVVPGSGLGVLRETEAERNSRAFAQLPENIRRHARVPEPLVITKSNSRSTIHRPGYLDYVGVKRFDRSGAVCGEHRFLGLYTSTAYSAPPSDIPLLRRKVANVIAAANFPAGSHAGKALAHILDTYPRDELFQITEDELLVHATGILHLGERQRFRLFVRRDRYERFVTCLIYAPRESYNTELRRKWQALLIEELAGTSSEFDVNLSGSGLARVLITVRTTPGALPPFDVRGLEARLAKAARRWEDDLKAALFEHCGEARANTLYRRYGGAFPAGYREDVVPRASVPDIELAERVLAGDPIAMTLYRPIEAPPETLRFKLVVKGAPIVLSDNLPLLERMGLRVLEERNYRIAPEGTSPLWMHDLGLEIPAEVAREGDIAIDTVRPVFERAFAAVYAGRVESDEFNRLVVAARLSAEEIVILRAYAKFFRQIGFALSQAFVEATLAAHPAIARMLVNLFRTRFAPEAKDATSEARQVSAIEAALDRVANLSEDRVLRQYLATILATVRTNYFRRDEEEEPRSFLALKIDSGKVPGMPSPAPFFEIFVYSPRFEAVHLRGGKVARGGLRWSDRPEDFRTEVLGLVKAQMVKNTVIVPVGSKGGFVLKKAPPATEREAFMREGVACYQDFLRGLLDVTDNLAAGKIVPPPQVRRHDEDDPYLVVAADKGTATFSDYANAVSKQYGFWLDDAFASGGSAGYDHKAMGITARGAWKSAERHFRELGVDIRNEPFTVVGIGDMSGDVFGNGMLLSRKIKLVAAFDHRHVFLDPDPDPEASFVERERLFGLPRSSWGDYDTGKISSGGGVWPRSIKAVPVSPEAQRALGIDREAARPKSLPPNELIAALLKAPVDLLYNGGIGTYVKASAESHADVGDRANDGVRVNGRDLRCRIVVEGGNLGLTQRGRVEYALAGADGHGGRINTDAIDNSAGVETSDHEVNIKVLLGLVSADGELTRKQRDALLATMTDDVAALVLRDNYFQNQSLALTRRIAPGLLDGHARFIQFLEKSGRLDRALEHLPTDEAIAERRARKLGLTVPELAVLLAYSKLWLYDELLASDVPDDPWVATALERYFPKVLAERYAQIMPRHPLRREIIATHVTNSMINRVGSIFVHRLAEATGAAPPRIVRAYLLAREVFGYVQVWQAVEALDWTVSEDTLAELLLEAQRNPPATAWFLRSRRLNEPLAETIEKFRSGVNELKAALPELLDGEARARREAMITRFTEAGVPESLATHVASFSSLGAALDLVEISEAASRSLRTAAAVYFAVGARLGLGVVSERIAQLPADTHWQFQARSALGDDLSGIQRELVGGILALDAPDAKKEDPAALCALWQERHASLIERVTRVLEELRASPGADIAMIAVALRELRSLA